MTALEPEEFEQQILRIIDTYQGDKEIMHSKLDYALAEQLRHLGYEDAVNHFENATKWYS